MDGFTDIFQTTMTSLFEQERRMMQVESGCQNTLNIHAITLTIPLILTRAQPLRSDACGWKAQFKSTIQIKTKNFDHAHA